MRPMFQRLALVAAVALAACSDRSTLTPSEPGDTPGPQRSFTPALGCELKTAQAIKDELHLLFINTPTNLYPSEQSTFGKVDYIDYLRNYSGVGEADSLEKAIVKTQDLITFITTKYDQIAGSAWDTPANDALLATITADLLCFVGVSGIFDLNPGDPDKFFNLAGVGGVWFPENIVPVGTMVVLTKLDPNVPALNTILDQFGSYIDIHLIPETTFDPEGPLPIVVVCPLLPNGQPMPVGDPLYFNLQVGHEAGSGFELGEPALYPGDDPCNSPPPPSPSSLEKTSPRAWLNSWLSRAIDQILPSPAHASRMFFLGGLGVKTTGFSTFGTVNYTLTATGLGTKTTSFSPRANSPAATPPADPEYLSGVAGTARTTDLPTATVTTPGGDSDGQNPIPGVKVTYVLGPTVNANDDDSEAKFCDGVPVTATTNSVDVYTDPDGKAAVPCIDFGTKAGFANLSATFDRTTAPSLQFEGSERVVLNVAGGNVLVETTAGPATTITAWNPSGGTYTGVLTPFTQISPAPEAKVTDDFGNPVSAGIVWETNASSGGSVSPATSTSDPTTGLSSVAWTLGDGNNELKAYLGAIGGPYATFNAATPSGVLEACTLSGTNKKTDLAKYSSALQGYAGYFSILSAKLGSIRTVTVNMSVTGQSSGTGNYVTTLRAFRNNGGVKGDQVAEGKPNTSDQTLKLPGSNNSPTTITFAMVPRSPFTVAVGQAIIFELEIKAASTRTFQVWYNTKTTAGTACYDSKLYAPSLTVPNFDNTTQFLRGLHLSVSN